MSGRTVRHRVRKMTVAGAITEHADFLAAEEPLAIRIGGEAVTLTMRTPGDDIDLAAGFLFSEGIIGSAADIVSLTVCDGTGCGHAGHDSIGNIADTQLRAGLSADFAPRRHFLMTSACGVCGRATSDELFVKNHWDIGADTTTFPATTLAALPAVLRAAQRVFARTGGLHAAGVFGAGGDLLAVREDVGRHNAVDKVVGWALRAGRLPLRGCVLLVSGRASFELAQKAALAGIPLLAAVSAPSSLAVAVAEQAEMTLVGFLRDGSMNVYTGASRLSLPDEQATAAADGQVNLREHAVNNDADHQDHDHDRDRS